MARKFKETEDLPKAKINKASLKQVSRLFEFIGPHKWKLYLGMVFLALTGGTALLFPWLLGGLVDQVKVNDFSKINEIGIYLIILLSAQSIFSYFRIYLFVNYTENTLAKLRQAVYSHMITLPMTFFAQKRVGDLNSRMSADISQVQDTLTTTIAEFLRQPCCFFFLQNSRYLCLPSFP
jgi:ABC-type multidrug transport system fused ATPase/permease subunit